MTYRCIARSALAVVLGLSFLADLAKAADCQQEAENALRQLETPTRPYRRETIEFDGKADRLIEFAPPDRMRARVSQKEPPYTFDLIRLGKEMWYGVEGEWIEVPSGAIDEQELPISSWEKAVKPSALSFACLGSVEYSGRSYTGYTARYPHAWKILIAPGQPSREVHSGNPELPPLWLTLLVDGEIGLPAYQIIAEENQLRIPQSWSRYTYPDNIPIEPPLR